MSWQQISIASNSVTRVSPVHTLACDPFKELLWVGSTDGQLSCCYSPELEARVRVQAHARGEAVLQVAPFQHGVLSTSSRGARFHSRGGVLRSEFDTSHFADQLTAACMTGENYAATDLLLAGLSSDPSQVVESHVPESSGRPSLGMLDILTNQVVAEISTEFEVSTLACGRVLACGTTDATLGLHDPRTLQPIRTLPGHQGGSRKVLVKGDRLLSLGYVISPADSGGYGRVDNVLKVYDLRTYRPLPPVLFTLGGGPSDACFLPNFSSTIVVVGLSGTWQTLDCEAGLPGVSAYQVDLVDPSAVVNTVALSNTGDLMFVGDSLGGLHGWSDKAANVVESIAEIQMNPYSAPVEYVSGELPPPPVRMEESTSLVAMPLPDYADPMTLLSNLLEFDQAPPNVLPPSTPPVDEKLVALQYAIKKHEFVGYIHCNAPQRATTTGGAGGARHQQRVAIKDAMQEHGGGNKSATNGGSNSGGGAFLPNHLPTLRKFCGRGRRLDRLHKKKSLPRFGDAYSRASRAAMLISKEYARVTIKIPRFGLYAFDFSSYNKTNYTGLDNLLPNSYCNPIIQLLYFIPTIRASMRAHVCERPNCLTCELGFLFHLLDHGKGNTAEPRNFLRTLRQLPEASGLGLLDMHENATTMQSPTTASAQGRRVGGGDDDELILASKIQDFWRFLLEQLHKEERESGAFQTSGQERSQTLQQLQYAHNVNQQRRHRNLTLTITQLQQSFVSLQQSMTAQGQHAGAIEHLRGQLAHFVNQNQHLYDEYESLDSDLFTLQLAAAERDLARAHRTTIDRVFGAPVEHRVSCSGTGGGGGSNNHHTSSSPPHDSLHAQTELYFKLSAYPQHDTELQFDQLLTDSMRDETPDASNSQRLFCNVCNAFTLQSRSKSLRAARSNHVHAHVHAPPESPFPRALNVMANVSTDLEWEWWKRRDERRASAVRREATNAAAQRQARTAAAAAASTTNLYDRFMAVGEDGSAQPAARAETRVTTNSSSTPSQSPGPSSGVIGNGGSGTDPLDDFDVHFLPHYLLLLITREDDGHTADGSSTASGSSSTRAVRVPHSVALRLQSVLGAIKSFQASHGSSASLLSQTLLATQLNACTLQQQLMVLTQQSFLVQSKLSFVMSQQQGLLNSLHGLTQQAQQPNNANVAAMIARQMQGLQASLQAVATQAAQLQSQKIGIAQKVAAVQSATASATGVTPGTAAAAAGGGMAGLQAKIQVLQTQLGQLQHSFASRMTELESDLRHLLASHLRSSSDASFDAASLAARVAIDDVAVYELASVVAHIADPPEKDSPLHTINGEHLVAHIRVERDVYDAPPPSAKANATNTLTAGAAAGNKQLTSSTAPVSPAPSRFTYASSAGGAASHLSSPHSPTSRSLAVTADQHDGAWFVFNDFVIRPSNGFEATRFNYHWKQPCAVVYKLMNDVAVDAAEQTNNTNGTTMTTPSPSNNNPVTVGGAAAAATGVVSSNPFMQEHMLYSYAPSLSSLRPSDGRQSFQPLVSSGPHMDVMDASTMVAIDCEFVSVQSELMEADAHTGENVVVRPARLTLARVSVVRGSGPNSGVPFIDDYIATSEPVVDYLTKYSGIVPGDLDRTRSTHHLTTLKHAYVRLRAMVERGVKFIGHGLKKDLQMLNIIIPSSQVFDTVDLFSLPNQRKLGLRFLARHLLEIDIQQETHDSIEDARTALQLYHKYMELRAQGGLAQCLHQLYESGHKNGFKL